MILMRRVRVLSLPVLAALPSGGARAACNPTGTEDCCRKDVSVECDSVTWPTAEGASAEPGCDEVSFTLDGIVNGRFSATRTSVWTPTDPDTDCPAPQTEPIEGAVVPEVTWEIFHNGLKIGEGGGPSALATNVSGGTVRCEFTMTSATEWCGEDTKTYEASTNLPTATLLLPEIVGRNDHVEPCEDPTDLVSRVEELAEDEEDLYTLSWSVSPEADEVTIFSETADKLRVLVADGSRLATTFHHPPMPEETEIWLEGIRRSDETNDCTVTMAYRIGDLLCEISATTTVVSVELDKFCYNRMDPHPEVLITNVVNLVPGGTATVWCAVSPDVVESDPDGFSQTFAVASAPGTYAFRTREVENRFRNKGWDMLRYTVYCDDDGGKRIAAGVSTPSHDAVETPPPECLATVTMGDAFASTPEEAYGHLESTPEIQAHHAEGSKPDYTVPEIKIFKKDASPWHTNEMKMAVLGATAVRDVVWDETQDTAVGLELTVPEVVAVNDRYDAGDPGKNAAIDLVPSDPDFSPPLSVEGIPGCVVTGTVTWTVSGGATFVVQKDGEMLVGSSFTFPYPGAPTPRLEGRTASDEKNDVVVTFELHCAAEGNPAAFRGQTLRAVARTTVVDTRWTHHRPDGAGKSGERYDLLECDLDLRPSVRIDSFGAEPGGPFVVEGTVVSMIDLPTDVRVNGTPVAATNLLVGGRTAAEALADGTWGLEPPYEVSFRHEMPSFAGETLEVAAFGSVSAHPGFHRFRGLGSGATNEVRSPVLAAPTMTGFYGDFLYKFEADHAGSGLGFLDCAEGLRCGAQSTNLPLYRLERTLLFLPPDATGPGGTRTEGFQIEDTPSGAPARGAYTALGLDDGSSATSISSIFPCDLDVKGGDGIVVPDCDEWWLGAFTEPGKTATLVVGDALGTAGIPTNGVATLSKTSDVGGVFPDFQTLTWRYGEPPPSAEDLVLTAAAPGVATFELRLSGEELASWDRVKITSLLVDVDVDSDNDDGFDAPSRSDAEDEVEDNDPGDGGTSGGGESVPGKILPVDSGDVDGDGIPDIADGYSLFPGNADMVSCEDARFTPVVFELPEPFDPATSTIWVSYDASDPRLVSTNAAGGYEPASGGRLRIWARNGGVARSAAPLLEGGDYLAPGAYAPATLGITASSRSATFYMEAVRKSGGGPVLRSGLRSGGTSGSSDETQGDIVIEMSAKPADYPEGTSAPSDTVRATGDPFTLDIEKEIYGIQCKTDRRVEVKLNRLRGDEIATWSIENAVENGPELFSSEDDDEAKATIPNASSVWVSAGTVPGVYKIIAENETSSSESDFAWLIDPIIDINGDYLRNGTPVDSDNEASPIRFTNSFGMVIPCNNNDDDEDGNPDCSDAIVNGGNDHLELGMINVSQFGYTETIMPENATLIAKMSISVPQNDLLDFLSPTNMIHVFPNFTTGTKALGGGKTDSHTLSASDLFGVNALPLWVEGRMHGAEVLLTLDVELNEEFLGEDQIRILVSPFFGYSNLDSVSELLIADLPGKWDLFNEDMHTAFTNYVPVTDDGPMFIQDIAEFGCSFLLHERHSSFQFGSQGMTYDRYLSPDFGCFSSALFPDSERQGGNVEFAPPDESHQYGRFIIGNRMSPSLQSFIFKQSSVTYGDNPIVIPTSWLLVGHVDELVSVIPCNDGFAIAVADLQTAVSLLEESSDDVGLVVDSQGARVFKTARELRSLYSEPNKQQAIRDIQLELDSIRVLLQNELDIPDSHIVRIPVLFEAPTQFSTISSRLTTELPNSVNMVVVRREDGKFKLGIPDPMFDPFMEFIGEQLALLGYTNENLEYIFTIDLHKDKGEAHCGSNCRRKR